MNMTKQRIVWGLMAMAWVMPIWADFSVVGAETPADTYGNAETYSFHKAITGGGTLSAKSQAELEEMLPGNEVESFYGRVRANFSTLTLDELKNKSAGINSYGIVGKKRATLSQTGFEVAVGYAWSSSFRGDIEYLANKTLSYSANPALTGSGIVSRKLDAQVKNNTLMANVYYDFAALERFRPYVTGGLGIAMNSIESTLTPAPAEGASQTVRTMRVAWGLGGGMRIGIFKNWMMDASVRYIRLGSGVSMKPNNSYKLLGTYSANLVSLGVVYLF